VLSGFNEAELSLVFVSLCGCAQPAGVSEVFGIQLGLVLGLGGVWRGSTGPDSVGDLMTMRPRCYTVGDLEDTSGHKAVTPCCILMENRSSCL
jgi:hypothetical protein